MENAELELRQFQLDVDRASWAVEAAFEWQTQRDQPMPDELVRSITAGLFGSKGSQEEAEASALDYISKAMVGAAAKARIGANGAELEISKPGRLDKRKVPKNGTT